MAPTIDVPSQVVLGDPFELDLSGLRPGSVVAVHIEVSDVLRRDWSSSMSATVNGRGELRLEYADAVGLLSKATMTPLPEGWEPLPARDFNEIRWQALIEEGEVAFAQTRLWVVPLDIVGERIGGQIVAEFFSATDPGAAPGLLLLGGSGGGMQWARRNAALLARQGYAALAVAYFNQDTLPEALIEIPIEYVESALDALKARPEVDSDRVTLIGYSKGAELALLVASRRPDVQSVVAYAPGSAVFQGFRAPDYPVLSSWSEGGVGLPFVPNNYDDRFFETGDGMYLWHRTLAQHDLVEAAAIPVERVNGDVLLISGSDDQIWPSTFMAEQIVARLRTKQFDHSVVHLAFPDAGHGIAAPPGEPLTSVSERLGGTVEGNAFARTRAWTAMLSFLGQTADR